MSEFRIPTLVAAGLWFASALAVGTYTLVALKQTATLGGNLAVDSFALGLSAPGLAANVAIQEMEIPSNKPLERGRFKPSRKQ